MPTFQARVQISPENLQKFIDSPNGAVFRYLSVQGEKVKQEARRRVGVYKPQPGDPFAARRIARRRPGTLRDSIVKRIATGSHGRPVVLVGSDDSIALIHHEGTPPHTITARKRPQLVFYAHGRVVTKLSVQHPGTKPNRYLTDSLYVIGQ